MYDNDIDVKPLMAELEAGPIQAYDAGGERLAVITNFLKHQVINKPTASKLRPPSGTLPEDYRVEGKGMEGIEMEENSPEYIPWSDQLTSLSN
jgi:hypothetical protein